MTTDQIHRRFRRLHLLVVGVASAAVLLLGSGCSVVSVPRPIGEKPHVLVAADWEGVWVSGHDVTKVTIASADDGQLRFAAINDEGGQPKLATGILFIRQSGETLFASVPPEGRDAAKWPYLWARIRRDTDQLLVWYPDPKRFAELVRTGKLAGKVDGDDVLLESPTAVQLAALVAGELGPVFDADASPAVLRRVAR